MGLKIRSCLYETTILLRFPRFPAGSILFQLQFSPSPIIKKKQLDLNWRCHRGQGKQSAPTATAVCLLQRSPREPIRGSRGLRSGASAGGVPSNSTAAALQGDSVSKTRFVGQKTVRWKAEKSADGGRADVKATEERRRTFPGRCFREGGGSRRKRRRKKTNVSNPQDTPLFVDKSEWNLGVGDSSRKQLVVDLREPQLSFAFTDPPSFTRAFFLISLFLPPFRSYHKDLFDPVRPR